MSQLLQIATRGGQIIALSGLGPPDFVDQGIPFVDDEGVIKLALDIGGAIAYHHQGLPFTGAGRLASTNDKPVEYYGSGGAPFDSTGLLVFGSGAIDHHSAGIPYTVDGQISTSAESAVSPEVQLVFDRMSALDVREQGAIQGFVDGMVIEGIWENVFEFYAPCLNATDYLTGFKTDTLVLSPNPPIHTPGEYLDFPVNSMHVLEGRNFETYSQPNILLGCYNVFTEGDVGTNSDLFGIENNGAQTYLRWRGNTNNDFNEYIGDTVAGSRSLAFQRPTGDFVGLGRIGIDMYNLQPGGPFFISTEPFVEHPSGGPVQWHGIWTNGAPAGGNMQPARYSCMVTMSSPPTEDQGKVRNLVLNFLIAIGVTGVPLP